MAVIDTFMEMLTLVSEQVKDLSGHFASVREGASAALNSYLTKLKLFHGMSTTDVFSRISANVEDSHDFILILSVLSFGLLMTFVGVRAGRLFVFYPFITGCIYFLLISPIRNSALIKQAERLYEIEAIPSMQNLMRFARQINLHLILISLILALIVLYFYSILKYVPALVVVFCSRSVFVPDGSKSTNYTMFVVFAIFLLYAYSKVFSLIERVVLAVVFSFVGSFIIVIHVNIANTSKESNTIPSYDEFLKNFSPENRDININNICSVLFILTFILGVWKQLEANRK